jgi:hypothetical protein
MVSKYKMVATFTEVIGWLQIAVSPLIIGLGIGAFVYLSNPTTTRLVIGCVIAALGLVVGIVFATRVWKKKGTVKFMSGVMATPELDKEEDKS